MVLFSLAVVAVVVLSVQIIYMTVFLIGFSRKAPGQSQFQKLPPVSIIVCAHDEEENLRVLLPILLSQDHPDIEIIIVDDRSNDGTFDFLLAETAQHPQVKMVQVKETPGHMHGKKFALTLGIKAAKHDWVLLTDADCRPGTRWASGMARHFSNDMQIVLGFSPYQRQAGLLNSFIRFEAYLTVVQYIGLALVGHPYMGVGRNLAYRKSLFLESKGFHDHMDVIGGDDDLFVNRHATSGNVAIAIGQDVVVHSIPKTSWNAYYVQKLRHLSVGRLYKAADRIILGLFSITWVIWPLTVLMVAFQTSLSLYVAGLVVLRWFMLYLLFSTAKRRLAEPLEGWKMPFLDFIYGFYYLVAGPRALVSKKVRWKI